MIIYKITNLINSKVYIGQTINTLEERWKSHVKAGHILYSAIKKYGKNSFKLEVLETCGSIEELNYLEAYYIKQEESLAPKGYNLTSGGTKNYTTSEETRNKQSISHLGKPAPWNSYKRSEETRRKIGEASRNNPSRYWTGKTRPSMNGKLVICVDSGKIYRTSREIAKEIEASTAHLCRCIKKAKRIKGRLFRLLETV